jgi:hypothetical protein
MSQTDRNVGILFVRVESAPIDLLSRGSNTATSFNEDLPTDPRGTCPICYEGYEERGDCPRLSPAGSPGGTFELAAQVARLSRRSQSRSTKRNTCSEHLLGCELQ